MNRNTFNYYNSEYDFYLMSVKVNPLNLVYVPKDILSQEICDEALKIDFSVIKDIPKRLLNDDLVRELLIDDPNLIKYVPVGYINRNLLEEVVDINPNVIRLITNTFLDELSNEKIADAISRVVLSGNFNYDGVWDYIFNRIDKKCLERTIDRIIDVDPVKVMTLPFKYIFAKSARKIVDKDPYLISYIPAKYIDQKMCDEIVLKHPQLLSYIPEKFVTEEMCMMIVRKNVSLIDTIPKEHMSKDLCMMALSINPLIIDKIPKEYIDKDVYNRIKVLLPFDKIVDLFNSTDKDTVKLEIAKDVWELLESYGSINEMAKNTNLTTNKIAGLIEKIEPLDSELYEVIKNKLSSNQTLWISNVVKDGNTLIKIIESLGAIESIFLSREQKIKFAYLYNRHCKNTLEDIYTFTNRCPNRVNDIKMLRNFFKRVLKYNYLNEENIQIPEKKTIRYNNKWLNKFDKNDYFKFKDGVPTVKNKYLEHEITPEVVNRVLDILGKNDIPLNDMIVKEAIREYFDDNLVHYINTLKAYDDELKLENNSKKSK